jgi:flagellar brake protein
LSSPQTAHKEPAPWPALETDEDLRVYAKPEIEHVLKDVSDKGVVVTAFFNRGQEFALTSIVDILPAAGVMFLDPGPDEAANRRWLAATDTLFLTNQAQVKIKFVARGIDEVSFRGERAFRVPMPPFLVRLQRREYFRIATSLVNPIICQVPVKATGEDARVVVLDISIGGIALLDNQLDLDLEPGNVYENCRIDLPQLGVVRTAIEVRNFSEVNLRNGLVARRAGCRFLDLSRAAENQVQRYIMSLELKKDFRSR